MPSSRPPNQSRSPASVCTSTFFQKSICCQSSSISRQYLPFKTFLLTMRQQGYKNTSHMVTIYEHVGEMTQTLGSRLHAMRESRDWTLDVLAEKTNLSKAYLSRLEGGDRQPSLAALFAIAKAFGVS